MILEGLASKVEIILEKRGFQRELIFGTAAVHFRVTGSYVCMF